MRKLTTAAILAAAALVSTSAPAQERGGQATETQVRRSAPATDLIWNLVAANTATTNEAAAMTATSTNTMAAETTTTPVAANDMSAPAAPEKKSFPWGVVGLLGLLGLIPRARRGS